MQTLRDETRMTTTDDVRIARQPIYDATLEVVAYRLLIGEPDDDAHDGLQDDAERSGPGVVIAAFSEIGLDRIVGGLKAHIEVSRRFLLEQHALTLPPDRVVFELAEHAEADDALVDVAARLATDGYRLGLTQVTDVDAVAALLPHVRCARVDAEALDRTALGALVDRIHAAGLTAIAGNVETYEAFATCRNAGFDLFLGSFFQTPETVSDQKVPTSHLTDLRSVAGLYASASFEELEQVISRDVGLSYRLLRYLNSAYFSLPRRVESVRDALTLLGERQVKRWATLVGLAGIQDKPHELLVTALVRGRLCELLAPAFGQDAERDACFTAGMFSVVDAMLDRSMADALAELPLGDELTAALLDQAGPKGTILRAVIAYERTALPTPDLPPGTPIGRFYLEALDFAAASSSSLAAPVGDGDAVA